MSTGQEEQVIGTTKSVVDTLLRDLLQYYWAPMYRYLQANPEMLERFSGFLLQPERIIFYFGRRHVAIEYQGPERINELPPQGHAHIQYFNYTHSDNLMKDIIGFGIDSTHGVGMPLEGMIENLVMPTNRGFEKLRELRWNFAAQDMVLSLNGETPYVIENRSARIVNSLFFDATDHGLVTRHIKWIDFIPIRVEDEDDHQIFTFTIGGYSGCVEPDVRYEYPLPEDFKYQRLLRLNRFVELVGSEGTTEPDITRYLDKAENKFILTMRFGAREVQAQKTGEWQSEEKEAIIPDFFIVNANGYADILEFKLPELSAASVVGRPNRETFSASINAYISQTRVYEAYFDDPNNRRWFEEIYGIRVLKPRRILVVGRRADFESQVWREIQSDYRNIEILTYDDLVDGVVAQFYMSCD